MLGEQPCFSLWDLSLLWRWWWIQTKREELRFNRVLISEQKDAPLSEAIARVDDLYQLLDWSSSGRQERSHQPFPAELSHQMKMGKNRGPVQAHRIRISTLVVLHRLRLKEGLHGGVESAKVWNG
eukprot:TRINITY_DN8019_c0_g1_i5.p1 TRINITY_DN8019_c0_g1~~TRINITY_DN8019_c0_g1_i5.p1  ORF type:complete len:125 (-),score=22.12 TRINITY_DN8019_c0_g1_i5:1492-1866(-)